MSYRLASRLAVPAMALSVLCISTDASWGGQSLADQASEVLTDGDVLFTVTVPENAVVWVNGSKTTQTGPHREFTSCGLTPGKVYKYEFRAEWIQADGSVAKRILIVPVQGGKRHSVNFLAPAGWKFPPPGPPKPKVTGSTTVSFTFG